ncbi:hypothetical protein [Erythrobacter insulae]|uniref:hypothetical protein n=1 Tax=Erythrobacter insulae TaxID=2584124 RepID=UPI00163DBD9D|nr:hypothetical protein [Erythrobacter insulae]
MNDAQVKALALSEIEQVCGAVGGLPDEPTFQDLIDLAEQTNADTLERLMRNQHNQP